MPERQTTGGAPRAARGGTVTDRGKVFRCFWCFVDVAETEAVKDASGRYFHPDCHIAWLVCRDWVEKQNGTSESPPPSAVTAKESETQPTPSPQGDGAPRPLTRDQFRIELPSFTPNPTRLEVD